MRLTPRYLRLILAMVLFGSSGILSAQNKFIPPDPYTEWDGVSHWSEYLILSPKYMGPNALPVPFVRTGEVPDQFRWSGLYEYYVTDGGSTHDFYTDLSLPVAHGKAALEVRYTPVEYYRTDSVLSRYRRSFPGSAAEGYALGDVYFGTTLHLLQEMRFLPDITFSMACRTASGTDREHARHTDTPGYWLNLAAGKSFIWAGNYLEEVRLYSNLGFYVWQTYLDDYPQDDALLYGVGINLSFRDFILQQTVRGYSGYMNNGDKPIVYRINLSIRAGQASFVFGYEAGIRDFPFSSIRTGLVINGFSSKPSS